MLSLLGDRDYKKILEAVGKVDKSFAHVTPAFSTQPALTSPGSFPSPPGLPRFIGPHYHQGFTAPFQPYPPFPRGRVVPVMSGSERADAVDHHAIIAERIIITPATVGKREMTRSEHKGTSINKPMTVICTV